MPKVFHDWTFEMGSQRFGLVETQRVVTKEFRQEVAPGRQVIVDLGPIGCVIPCSLAGILGLSFAASVTLVAFAKRQQSGHLAPVR